WPNGRAVPPTLPSNMPAEFTDTVWRCLSENPGERPTVAELQTLTKPTPSAAPGVPSPPLRAALGNPLGSAARPEVPLRAEPRSLGDASLEEKGFPWPAIVGIVVVIALLLWGGSRFLFGPGHRHEDASRVAPGPTAATPAGTDASEASVSTP